MDFKQPNFVDRWVNRAFGFLVKLGIGLSHNYLLEVRGRKSGGRPSMCSITKAKSISSLPVGTRSG